jgi:hypothetical protein
MQCTLIVKTNIFLIFNFKLLLWKLEFFKKVCEEIKIMIKEVGILKYGWCIDGWGMDRQHLFLIFMSCS